VGGGEGGGVNGRQGVGPPSWLDGAGLVRAVLGTTETTAQVVPARFTTTLLNAARCELRIGVVDALILRDGAARGVRVGGDVIEADAVVLAMGPWTGRVAAGLLP